MFRTLSDRMTVPCISRCPTGRAISRTLILADILQGECQSGVLPFNNSNLSKRALPDDPQQSEVIEIHYAEKQLLAWIFDWVGMENVWCIAGTSTDSLPSSLEQTMLGETHTFICEYHRFPLTVSHWRVGLAVSCSL